MEDRNRVVTVAAVVGVVALLLGCVAGALAGGAAGFLAGRRAAERNLGRIPEWRVPDVVPNPDQPFGEVPGAVEGALVRQVTPGTAAERAGLRAGDVITAVDNVPIDQNHDLRSVIQQYRPGDRVRLHVWRNGEQIIRATLGENPEVPGQAYLGVLITSVGPQMPQSPSN